MSYLSIFGVIFGWLMGSWSIGFWGVFGGCFWGVFLGRFRAVRDRVVWNRVVRDKLVRLRAVRDKLS